MSSDNSSIKKLAGQTAIYGVSTILGRMVNFLLTPFYTQLLSLEEFGVMSTIYAGVTFLNVVFQFGMETTYFRFANKYDERSAYNASQTFVFILGIALLVPLLVSAPLLSSVYEWKDISGSLRLAGVIVFLDAFVAIPFARLRFLGRSKKFALARLTSIGLNVGFNLFFLIVCGKIHAGEWLPGLQSTVQSFYDPNDKIFYVFLSNLLSNAIFIPILIKELLQWRWKVSGELFKPMLRYAYPLVFVGLAGMINEVLDRILLKVFYPDGKDGLTTDTAIGIYSGVYKLAILMNLVIQAFRYAAEPFFFSKAKDRNAPETFVTVMKWFVIACSIIFVGVSLSRELLGSLFLRNEGYQEGLLIAPILLLANLFLGIYYNQSIWYKLTDKTHFGTLISSIGAVITLVANIALIPVLGYVGSAVATLLCYGGMAVVSYFLGQKHYPIPYDVKNALSYILLGSFLVGVSFIKQDVSMLVLFFERACLIMVFLAVIFMRERRNLPFKKG